MTEYHKFIYDEEQVKRFYSLLSPLKDEEAYFLSMSARNKYLTEEERKEYNLGRTEMFARELVKEGSWEAFIRVLKSMQVSRGGYTSRGDVTLPDKCLVVYANINPRSGIKALKEFQEKTTQLMFDMLDKADAKKKFSGLDTLMMNCYQRANGTKTLIDIDFDVPRDGKDILDNFLKQMGEHSVTCHVIETKSGWHVLLERKDIKFNYTEFVKEAHKEAQARYGNEHVEVMINKNDMCVVPGTIQAGHEVRFI